MGGFGEHVDRALYLSHHEYHQLVQALLDAPERAFLEVFDDYPTWRAERVTVRAAQLAGLAEQAAAQADRLGLDLGHDQDSIPARPRRRDAWRRRA